jgi:molecular chaperone GrpE
MEDDFKKDVNIEELSAKLAKLEAERGEYLAGWQRAKADYLNYKKEESARLGEVAKFAAESLIKEMVTILDNFDLGLRALEKSGPVEKGVYMIRTQVEDTLRKYGLSRLDLPEGSPFDPATAEAIAEKESSAPPGTVAEVIEPGYKLHDKVIRPARVIISKGQHE